MRKKFTAVFLAVGTIIVLALSSCGGGSSEPVEEAIPIEDVVVSEPVYEPQLSSAVSIPATDPWDEPSLVKPLAPLAEWEQLEQVVWRIDPEHPAVVGRFLQEPTGYVAFAWELVEGEVSPDPKDADPMLLVVGRRTRFTLEAGTNIFETVTREAFVFVFDRASSSWDLTVKYEHIAWPQDGSSGLFGSRARSVFFKLFELAGYSVEETLPFVPYFEGLNISPWGEKQ